MEWAMQEHDSSFSLPYWEWTTTPALPTFWLSGPVKAPATSACGGAVSQRAPLPINSVWLTNMVQTALATTNLMAFASSLNSNPHNYIHGRIGCDMGTVGTASYDPIFYLHHGYVDYLIAFWQQKQVLDGFPPLSSSTSTLFQLPLEPFNRVFSNAIPDEPNPSPRSFRNSEGINTFDYEEKFCYKYDQLLFNGQTPGDFRRAAVGTISLTPLEFLYDQVERNKNNRVYIAVPMRDTGITSEQTVTLCSKMNCVEVVKLYTFGFKNKTPNFEAEISRPYLVPYEVSHLVKELNSPALDDKLRASITGYKDNERNELPMDKTYQPVVIWRIANKTDGMEVMNIHVGENTKLAETIFYDPPYQVQVYDEVSCKTPPCLESTLTIHYQHQAHDISGQRVTFGHDQFYEVGYFSNHIIPCTLQCTRERATARLPTEVTILQPSDFGWSINGQFLDTSKPLDHIQGDLLDTSLS